MGAARRIAVTSTIGLTSALLGDGLWDMLSWMALFAPVTVVLWYALPPMLGRRHLPPDFYPICLVSTYGCSISRNRPPLQHQGCTYSITH